MWFNENLKFLSQFSEPYTEEYQTAIAELSLLCIQTNRQKNSIIYETNFINIIKDIYCKANFYEYPFKCDARSFIGHLVIWSTLNHFGIKPKINKEKFQDFIDNEKVNLGSLSPFRLLELKYWLDISGFNHQLVSEDFYFSSTFLSNYKSKCTLSIQDAYDITHTIFYTTDFGSKSIPIFLKNNMEANIKIIKEALYEMLQIGNLDLVIELLLSLKCLKYVNKEFYSIIWETIKINQDSSGFVWGLDTIKEKHELSKYYNHKYIFWKCYHPTLVTVMAGYLGN